MRPSYLDLQRIIFIKSLLRPTFAFKCTISRHFAGYVGLSGELEIKLLHATDHAT